MQRGDSLTIQRWWLSALLLVTYIGLFQGWVWISNRSLVVVSAGLTSALLLALCLRFGHYFTNRWDAFGHLMVVLDIVLEGVLIPVHDHYGFYLCALAFGVVVGGYRAWRLHLLELDQQSKNVWWLWCF